MKNVLVIMFALTLVSGTLLGSEKTDKLALKMVAEAEEYRTKGAFSFTSATELSALTTEEKAAVVSALLEATQSEKIGKQKVAKADALDALSTYRDSVETARGKFKDILDKATAEKGLSQKMRSGLRSLSDLLRTAKKSIFT